MRMFVVAVALAAGFGPAEAAPLKVVASFSILADMVGEVGGDRVSVDMLVGPGSDAHVFQPTPQDARKVAEADLVVVNGLGFEGWMDRLVEATGYKGPVVVASAAIVPLPAEAEEEAAEHGTQTRAHDAAPDHAADADHDHAAGAEEDHEHGAYDPHAWQDFANAKLYVEAIASGLSAADPAGRAGYVERSRAYVAKIDAAQAEARAAFDSLPEGRRTILTTHDAFAYFGRAMNIAFVAPQGISTESEPSARDVAALEQRIRADGVDALFLEVAADNRLVQGIAGDTGVAIGGELWADTLSAKDGPAPTYLAMMGHNVSALVSALARATTASQ